MYRNVSRREPIRARSTVIEAGRPSSSQRGNQQSALGAGSSRFFGHVDPTRPATCHPSRANRSRLLTPAAVRSTRVTYNQMPG